MPKVNHNFLYILQEQLARFRKIEGFQSIERDDLTARGSIVFETGYVNQLSWVALFLVWKYNKFV